MVIWDRNLGIEGDPFREFERLRRRMNRLFGSALRPEIGETFPPVNVWSNNEKAVVRAEVPGIRKEDLDISVENDMLTIKGHREPEQPAEGEAYRRRERGHGSFRRTVGLPFAVEPDEVRAEYKDGILSVELKRHEASKPRQIEVK